MTRRKSKMRHLPPPRSAPFRAVQAAHWLDRYEAQREKMDAELRQRLQEPEVPATAQLAND